MLAMHMLHTLLSTAAIEQPPAGALLWRELRVGMTPEQTAAALRGVDGVSEVSVNRSRKGKLKSIAIKYTQSGVLIGDTRVEIVPTFEGETLQEVSLTGRACASVAAERMNLLRESLKAKYDQSARERVIDEDGVEFQQRVAFWNDETRVRMSWAVDVPSADYIYSNGRGVQGALATLANSMAQASRDAALRACPNDKGASVVTTINYSSQATFSRSHAEEVKAREEKAKATKDAL